MTERLPVSAYGKMYSALQLKLEEDLKATGFNPKKAKPCEEPAINAVSKMSDEKLLELYDQLIAYYDYLSDQVTRLAIYVKTTKERMATVKAAVILDMPKGEYKNAELRLSYVQTHPDFLTSQQDYLYFRQLHDAQENRLKKFSKLQIRVTREMWFRVGPADESKNQHSGRIKALKKSAEFFKQFAK